MYATHNIASLWTEVCVRLTLFIIFGITEVYPPPFHRKIHPEEYWLYKNPVTPSYVPVLQGAVFAIIMPCLLVVTLSLMRQDKTDAKQSALGITLSLGLTGSITNIIKLAVGRPRPDFLFRCFPDGNFKDDMKCTGDPAQVTNGYKSFPSGHSSFAFSGLGFVALYLAAKLHIFNSKGRGQSWRFVVSAAPLVCAMVIALSRTADYHHHWQDVLVGSILGFTMTYISYRQYYPSLERAHAHRPYITLTHNENSESIPEVLVQSNNASRNGTKIV